MTRSFDRGRAGASPTAWIARLALLLALASAGVAPSPSVSAADPETGPKTGTKTGAEAAVGTKPRGNRPPMAPRQGRQPRPDDPATTGVFGVQGSGRRFVYVFDRSASMANHGKAALEAAQKEVAESLTHLHKGNEFAILFYADVVDRYPGGTGEKDFAPFTVDDLRKANARLENLAVAGHATHARAIHDALVMNPDVVFVITDSHKRDDIDKADLENLRRLLGTAKIMVAHLGSDDVQRCPNLAELAGKSGGRYEALSFDGESWRLANPTPADRSDDSAAR